MTQRLGVRVDLRKGNLMNEEDEESGEDGESKRKEKQK